METHRPKEELKSSTETCGGQFANMVGASGRPGSSANSWATLLHPRPGGAPTSVKDQGRFSWALSTVLDMKQTSISVAILGGLITTAVIIWTLG